MGFRTDITTLFVSGLIMAIVWEVSDAQLFRDLTGNFLGKIAISILVVVISKVVGSILSGGK